MAGPESDLPTSSIMDLPKAMTAAAFLGIAWYITIELNVRIAFRFTRGSIYLWSVLTCAWGILLQGLSITLLNFNVWTDYSATVVIHLTWFAFVSSQSVVLYSRLNLVLKKPGMYRWVLYLLIFNNIAFGLSTVILGLVSRHPSMEHHRLLGSVYLNWDKVELSAFFIVETIISLLYIYETHRHLLSTTLVKNTRTSRMVLKNLIWVNVFIIALDCSLLGLCFAGYFFLQGYYKATVYAIKLRTEFAILNDLRTAVSGCSSDEYGHVSEHQRTASKHTANGSRHIPRKNSTDSDVEMIGMSRKDMERSIRRDDVVTVEFSTRSTGNVRDT
ncbi:hypothetical protein EJ04DRAFT_477555 [Polyplosphaeria fusca]|uniref:DUF7703 domain-containing protein n=1 Tax=Polyplosphaeria fusca TaxID=682080 RepID=A0A9P4UVJ4_9PLEO|nr:hypothetical protein EJ04DRAFT_477555 [Polyplosphaeria fusca]